MSKIVSISDTDFERLCAFMKQNYGIELFEKRQLIVSRLNSYLMQNGYKDFTLFLDDFFKTRDEKVLELIVNKLTTNYTYFMREKEHFTYLNKVILPELEKKNRAKQSVSVWSAGCSSGEEPYTLSISLLEYFSKYSRPWDTRILATDISAQALLKADKGVYSKPADIDDLLLRKYFDYNLEQNTYTIKPVLRKNVIYRTFNLMEQIKFRTKFDVIFCRNVMIYFNQDTREALIKRFSEVLNPGGYFIVSHSEALRQTSYFEKVGDSIYKKL